MIISPLLVLYKEKIKKMPIKSVKIKILMFQGSLDPKIRFLGQKVSSVALVQTDGQTDTKVNTEDTLSGFQEFFLQPSNQGAVQKKCL